MILIKGGTVHDGTGSILKNTDILIENGKIKDIGNNIEVSENVDIFDASGKTVFPGLIESLNVWGAQGPGWGDDDLGELSDPVTPQMDVVYSFDQDSMCFQRVFEYGVTSAAITPSTSNVLGGYSAVFKTFGSHPYQMLVRDKIGQVASITSSTKNEYGNRNISPMTRMGAVSLLRESIIMAIEYKENHKEYNPKWDALQMVIDRKVPLLINTNTKSEMDTVELALKDLPVDLVFTGAFGIDEDTGSILDRDYKVILGDLTGHMSYVNTNVDFEGIKRLMENGVDIAISSCGDRAQSGKESLLWNAILCYKNGLEGEDVLKMITSIPAKILGVDERIGSIEIGKDADLVVWSGNPIKTYSAKVLATFINGENILNARRYNTCWS